MNTKLLLLIALVFYLWGKKTDDFLLYFCAAHTLILSIGVFLFRLENPSGSHQEKDEYNQNQTSG
jgi:hypothetical protein